MRPLPSDFRPCLAVPRAIVVQVERQPGAANRDAQGEPGELPRHHKQGEDDQHLDCHLAEPDDQPAVFGALRAGCQERDQKLKNKHHQQDHRQVEPGSRLSLVEPATDGEYRGHEHEQIELGHEPDTALLIGFNLLTFHWTPPWDFMMKLECSICYYTKKL